jgi:20S proteasome subunit alpha 7
VLGVENTIASKMMVEGTNRRIAAVDLHAGIVMAGLAADARQLVNRGRAEAKQYKGFYGSEITGKVLSDRVAAFVHMYTLYWYLRPFGCSVLLSSFDEASGPGLYRIEPSGVCYKYKAAAIGKHKDGAHTELEKLDFSTLTCAEAVKELARIIYKLHDDVKDKAFELEMSWVCEASGRKQVRVPADIRDEAVKLAVEAKEKADMEDSSDEDE